MPAINLRRIQIGKQTTFATPVAATALLRGVTDASAEIVNNAEVVQELGFVTGSTIVPGSTRTATMDITFVPSYQDIRYVLQGVFGAPSTTGSNDPFTHTWDGVAVEALPTPQIYTIEYGMAGAEYRMVGGIVREFTLTTRAGEMTQCDVSLIGHSLQTTTLTNVSFGARANDALSHVNASLTIDPPANPYGTTSFSNAFISAEWMVNTNRHVKHFGGSVTPADWGDGRWESTLTLELEYTSAVKALVDSLLSGNVLRRIRVQWQASPQRNLTIEFFGTLVENPSLFGDRDGNATVELSFAATIDRVGTTDRWLRVVLLNNEQNLP